MAVVLMAPIGGAHADNPGREFMMSCTYGVLAGTLVGAASLAFTKKPSDNMHRVARGASLGLYTGILLGLYVVYIVPGMESTDEDPAVAVQKRLDKISFFVSPTSGLRTDLPDGLRGDWIAYRF